jgi:serine/threonine protein phosphatase PrpC
MLNSLDYHMFRQSLCDGLKLITRKTSLNQEQEELRLTSGTAKDDAETEYTVIVASDGIWDCWKYNDFTEYMNDTLREADENIKDSVERVLQESIRRAKANFGVKHFDDASLIGWRITV